MWFGPLGIAISGIVTTVISCILNMSPTKKLTGYSWQEQVRDIFPALWMSIVMSIAVFAVGSSFSNLLLKLVIQVLTGGSVYILLATVSKNERLGYLWSIIKGMIKKKKQSNSTN